MLDLSTPPAKWVADQGLGFSVPLLRFLYNGLATNTRSTYNGARVSYENFCARKGWNAWPAKSIPVAEWMAFRAIGNNSEPSIPAKTIKQYLSHLRSVHVDRGYSMIVFEDNSLSSRVLDGISRLQVNRPKRKSTPLTLRRLKALLQPPKIRILNLTDLDELNFRTACLVAFAGFLRPGEFTYTGEQLSDRYDFEQTRLLRSDVTFVKNDQYAIIHLKRSKTDYKHDGVDIMIAGVGGEFCPVLALRTLFAKHKRPPNAPLFAFVGGAFTVGKLVTVLRTKLKERGTKHTENYTGKCWRRGAAQTALNLGMTEGDRKKLGRWTSDSCQLYVHEDPRRLLGLNIRLQTGEAPPL